MQHASAESLKHRINQTKSSRTNNAAAKKAPVEEATPHHSFELELENRDDPEHESELVREGCGEVREKESTCSVQYVQQHKSQLEASNAKGDVHNSSEPKAAAIPDVSGPDKINSKSNEILKWIDTEHHRLGGEESDEVLVGKDFANLLREMNKILSDDSFSD